MEKNHELRCLIEQKMAAIACMADARDSMEKARQAYEFYQGRVNTLVAEIAHVSTLGTYEPE